MYFLRFQRRSIRKHSCSVRTVRLGKSSGTLRNFLMDMELYGTLRILRFAGLVSRSDRAGVTFLCIKV